MAEAVDELERDYAVSVDEAVKDIKKELGFIDADTETDDTIIMGASNHQKNTYTLGASRTSSRTAGSLAEINRLNGEIENLRRSLTEESILAGFGIIVINGVIPFRGKKPDTAGTYFKTDRNDNISSYVRFDGTEYTETVEKLNSTDVDLYEINLSCPNVKQGALAFGQDPKVLEETTRAIKRAAKKPVIIKLSPNVTSIADMARAAEAGGADCISLINTLIGMKIDIDKRKFVLANKTGGFSGPAVKPVAVRMVYDAAHAVKIPVIGMGGISNAEDALEFILAGATAVSVGTANFHDPGTTIKVIEGIEDYMARYGVEDINELVGAVSA